jgi:hypothetical protein
MTTSNTIELKRITMVQSLSQAGIFAVLNLIDR